MTREREDSSKPAGDYLWDGTGTPDAEVARLEGLLSPLKHRGEPPEVADEAPQAGPIRIPRRRRSYVIAGAVAAAVAIGVVWWAVWRPVTPPGGGGPDRPGPSGPAWAVKEIEGQIGVGSRKATGRADLYEGEWLETGASGKATIEVPSSSGKAPASLGHVTVLPGSRVRLVTSRATLQKLELARGELHAFITAPPKIFVVDTPAATAVDMGCAYKLKVDKDGFGELTVTLGRVELINGTYKSNVVAGTICRVDGKHGPGVPRVLQTDSGFVAALHDLEQNADDAAALAVVLSLAKERDSVSLWHLIPRTSGEARSQVIKTLIGLTPLPSDVNVQDVQNLDDNALDRWWNVVRLGLL